MDKKYQVFKKYWLLGALLTIAIAQTVPQNPTMTAVTAQTPARRPQTSNLPSQPFPVPGWLAFATVPANSQQQFSWSPSHPNGQAIIFTDNWSQVRTGTPLVAVAPGLKQPVTFLRSSQERYGCDGVPTSMAAFSAPRRLPEGPVWVMRQPDAGAATALRLQDLPLAQVPANLLPRPLPGRRDARAWKAGTATILWQKQGTYKVKFTVAINSQVVYSKVEEKYAFGESDRDPVNLLENRGQPGIPQPVGAFQLKAGAAPTIVLWIPGYEGHSFNILVPEGRSAKLLEAGSVYFCGY